MAFGEKIYFPSLVIAVLGMLVILTINIQISTSEDPDMNDNLDIDVDNTEFCQNDGIDTKDENIITTTDNVPSGQLVLLNEGTISDSSPCQPQTEDQLYSKLRALGEFNNRYMGITPDDFPDILEISQIKNDSYNPGPFDPRQANGKLKNKIEEEMKTFDWLKGADQSEKSTQKPPTVLGEVKSPEELGIPRRMTRDVDTADTVTESTTTINYCLQRGTETEDGYLRLCTVCAATTELPENYFPRYINEAICDPDGSGRACFPIAGTDKGHGACKQRVFNLSMLRRTGNCVPTTQADDELLYLEEWEVYTQSIRVWCDCELNRQSFLAGFV